MEAGFRLAEWSVRPRHGTLTRDGAEESASVRLEPRVMAVLVELARHAGEVVTRDEFSRTVWGGRIVTDEALSRCISVLRQVFADDAREPKFIRTIARVGYSLLLTPMPLVSVAQVAPEPPPPAVSPGPTQEPIPVASPTRLLGGRRLRWGLAGIGTVALVTVFASVYAGRHSGSSADAPPPPVRRLLVLPFDTTQATGFGQDVGVELADEIANSLAHVERLQVAGRTSADRLASEHIGAVEAGRKLSVDAVLDGEVAAAGGGLRVTVHLRDTRDARVLWTRVYERQATDIFAVESSIASAVVRELVGLLNRDGVTGVPSIEPESRDLEAYRLYLRGAHQVRLRGEDSLRRAVDLFSAALRRDPTYARAAVGLAAAYTLLPGYSFEDPTEMFALADKALADADRLSESRVLTAGTRGYLSFMRGQWIESETAFRTAILADPNNPDLRQMYSQLLGAVGRFDAALSQVRLAQEIDPLAPVVADRLGILYLWRGRDAEAAAAAALAHELGLDELSNPEMKVLLELHLHEDAAARESLQTLQHTLHRPDAWVPVALEAYRHPEKRAAAIRMLDETRAAGGFTPRVYFGIMVLLESPERALSGFAALPNRGGNDLEFLFSDFAAAVRRDPAFGEFVKKMGLDAYWDRFGWPPTCRREGSAISCR